jgi:hypothetical protein
MAALVRILLRNGVRKGLMGGNRRWLVVGGVAAAVRLLQKLAERDEGVIYSGELHPGESLVVANSPERR